MKYAKNILPSIHLPLLRRVTPELIANNITKVQPLSTPTGLSFFFKNQTKYKKCKVRLVSTKEINTNWEIILERTTNTVGVVMDDETVYIVKQNGKLRGGRTTMKTFISNYFEHLL